MPCLISCTILGGRGCYPVQERQSGGWSYPYSGALISLSWCLIVQPPFLFSEIIAMLIISFVCCIVLTSAWWQSLLHLFLLFCHLFPPCTVSHYVSPSFLSSYFLQLIARITKHGWFDGDKKVFVFRDILDEVGKFLRVSCSQQYVIITRRQADKLCNLHILFFILTSLHCT